MPAPARQGRQQWGPLSLGGYGFRIPGGRLTALLIYRGRNFADGGRVFPHVGVNAGARQIRRAYGSGRLAHLRGIAPVIRRFLADDPTNTPPRLAARGQIPLISENLPARSM